MEQVTQNKLTPLQQGVKLIGIGKHGSKKLPEPLIEEITTELLTGNCAPILIGAFFGALLMKEIEPAYYLLEHYSGKGSLNDASLLWSNLCKDVPLEMKPIGVKLLNKQILHKEEAYQLGQYLFSDESGELFRGMAMSILRIRYESDEEYEGLYDAIAEHEDDHFFPFKSDTLVQLAEPFDGTEHSYMLTPLLATAIQEKGYTVVASCGANGGPKFVLNTADLYNSLSVPFVKKRKSSCKQRICVWLCLSSKRLLLVFA